MEVGAVGLTAAFAVGVVSFVSPCVLPLVPAYVSYVAGQPLDMKRKRPKAGERLAALTLSAFFVLGFSAVFVTFGASATFLGRLLLQYRYEANLIGGAVVILFGLLMLGMTSGLPWLMRDFRFHPHLGGGRPLPAFVLGLAFGFGWTPCIGPILGAILTVSAVQTTPSTGVGLLATYAAGLGRAVPAHRALHARARRAAARAAPHWHGAADRGRPDPHRHGHRHDDRPALALRLLAAQHLPDIPAYRIARTARQSM